MSLKVPLILTLSVCLGAAWFVLFDSEETKAISLTLAKPWRYPLENGEVEFDRTNGQISRWIFKGRSLIDLKAPTDGPLVLQSESGEIAYFTATSREDEKHDSGAEIMIGGLLKTSKWSTPASIRYRLNNGGRNIAVAFSATAPASMTEGLAQWKWVQPLSLSPRKRIFFKGEHGLDFETRYFYQFTSKGGQLLNPADRNEWRWFSLDQLGENAFRLWKSEGETTAPLTMQEGRNIPPYVQLRNQDRGISVEAPSLSKARGRSLQIDAANGGRIIFYAWSPSCEPLHGPLARSLFDNDHELILTADTSEAALFNTRESLNAKYPSSKRPLADELLHEPAWVQAAELPTRQYVSGGYPFAQGQLRQINQIQLKVGGAATPFQGDALGYWPDGSIKWVLLTFPINPAKAAKEVAPPYVSFRNGTFLPIAVSVSPPSNPGPTAKSSDTFTASIVAGGGVILQNGDLKVRFDKGPHWISATLREEPIIQPSSNSSIGYIDLRRNPKPPFPFHHRLEGGTKESGSLLIDTVELETSGPLLKVVKLTGVMDTAEKMPVVIRVKMYAGIPDLEVSYSTEFKLQDPRQTFLTGLGIQLPIQHYRLDGVRFGEELPNAAPASGLVQESRSSRLLKGKSGESLRAGGATGWIEARGDSGRFVGVIRNFVQTAPKAITLSPEGGIRFELWPNATAAMDLRRYSNFPHLGQGESAPTGSDWVASTYYPNEPVAGISRTHELLFSFQPADSKISAETLAADYQSPPLLYAGADAYVEKGVQLPSPRRDSWPKAWSAWETMAGFWLYHRELYGWEGFWSFGDFRHRFRDAYGWILPVDLTIKALKGEVSREVLEKHEIADAYQSQDWNFDNGRWGWTNTEGIPNLFMQNEYLRTGNRMVYFAAEAMARFSRDVVIRHSGKWFGTGTRHGVQHWSDGDHEERQTIATEFRLHYFLSGDRRTSDVVRKLYEGYYNKTTLSDPACHGGRLAGLAFHAELTGNPEHFAQLNKYAQTFVHHGALSIGPTVSFPDVSVTARQKKPDQMFFHYFGGLHTLLEYQQITNDSALKSAFLKLAEETVNSSEWNQLYRSKVLRNPLNYTAVAFAALHAEDPVPYRKFLEETLKAEGWRRLYQPVTANAAHWSGRTAFLRDNSPACFFWINWAPYICTAIGKDTVWTPEMEKEITSLEAKGSPSPRTEGSWQSEFDESLEIREYLDPQKPWPLHP